MQSQKAFSERASMQLNQKHFSHSVIWARLFASMVLLLGVTVLCAWQWNIQELKSVIPGLISMMPNTALCFVLTGTALLIQTLQKTHRERNKA